MDDFNQPQQRAGIDDNFRKFAVETQVNNICKILGGEVQYILCRDKKTQHRKIVIEYDHSSNLQ
tara:strand:- start:262 stop:453 length:192 start_codon:yes stop_codon:yes gene_type:complete